MKKYILNILGSALFLAVAANAGATTMSVSTGSKSLEHNYMYAWGMKSGAGTAFSGIDFSNIKFAAITLKNVWDDNTGDFNNDQLALYLLDDTVMYGSNYSWQNYYDGASIATDFYKKDTQSNIFDNAINLKTYTVTEDISNTQKRNLTYYFTGAQLASLRSYLLDATPDSATIRDIGLGFDPDCHFRMDDIIFTVSDQPVPEPGTMVLLGAGLLGLAIFGKRRMQKS